MNKLYDYLLDKLFELAIASYWKVIRGSTIYLAPFLMSTVTIAVIYFVTFLLFEELVTE